MNCYHLHVLSLFRHSFVNFYNFRLCYCGIYIISYRLRIRKQNESERDDFKVDQKHWKNPKTRD